jgi:hypothetical protein
MRSCIAAVAVFFVASLLLAPPPAPAQGSPGWAISNAEAAANTVEALRDDEAFAPFFQDPAVKKHIQQAYAKLALAKDALADVHSSYGGSQAYEFGIAAERAFRDIEKDLWVRRDRQQAAETFSGTGVDPEVAARQQLLDEIDALVRQGREILARPASSWPSELEARGDLGRALKSAAGTNGSMPSDRLRRIREELLAAGTTARYAYRTWPSEGPLLTTTEWVEPPPYAPVPNRLWRGVEGFLRGDYQGAADLLADVEMGSANATALAHLIRGAATYSLYVESGERDRALIESARADARACRGCDPGITPVRDAFSPRYAALFSDR